MSNAAPNPLSPSVIKWSPPGPSAEGPDARAGARPQGQPSPRGAGESRWERALLRLAEVGGLGVVAAGLFAALLGLGLLVWLGLTALAGPGLHTAALAMGLMAALGTGIAVALLGAQARMAQAQRRLWSMAILDPLTGAHNRAGAELVSQGMLQEAAAWRSGFGVILVDADHFKRVNDSMGHNVGDEVLRGLVQRLKGDLRVGDVVARYGGEEFLILIEGCQECELAALAGRLRATVAGSPLSTSAGPVSITISIGVASFRGEASLEAMVRRADVALYNSKRGGRNRYCVAPTRPEPLWN
jgi:diguanylate cyclase (GGDEF)-like protein